MKRGWVRGALLAAWVAAVASLSLLPLEWKYELGTKGAWHDGGHVAAFAVTALLYLHWRGAPAREVWRAWPVAVFAIAIEFGQMWFFDNDFEWWDVGTDLLGIALATGVRLFSVRR